MLCLTRLILPVVLLLTAGTAMSQTDHRASLYLSLRHSDSIISQARVRINGKKIPYDHRRKQYRVARTMLPGGKNQLLVERKGFPPLSADLGPLLARRPVRKDTAITITLTHHWDSFYLYRSHEVPGYADPRYIMVLNVEDSAKLFQEARARRLEIVRMFPYCSGREDQGKPGIPDSYLLTQHGGAAFHQGNAQTLEELRVIFGAEFAGPPILSYYPLVLTNRIALELLPGTTTERMKQILDIYGLKIYSHSDPLMIVEAAPGIGTQITGIAQRLKRVKEISAVSNVITSMVCPD
jgi:hypothetical protein